MSLRDKIKLEPEWKMLNEDQKAFCLAALEGDNLFLTGGAGTGKSFVSRFLIDFYEKNNVRLGKTATTGIAALNIGGSTIHSWAGVGLCDLEKNHLYNTMVMRSKKAITRIRNCRVLFIDEVSMLSAEVVEKLDFVFKKIRTSKRFFGGMQVIIVGDFLQLPPVFKEVSEKNGFIFQTEAWRQADFNVAYLTELIRQQADKKFAKFLNEIRVGNGSNLGILKECVGRKWKDAIQPVIVYCKNVDVDVHNSRELNKIKTDSKTFYAIDSGEKHHVEYFNRNCLAPKILILKVGAQVMLLKNINPEEGFVNGSVGVVTGFEGNGVKVKFAFGGEEIVEVESWEVKEQVIMGEEVYYRTIAYRKQIPLKLAYAATVHKTQGQTLDRAIIDLNEAFESGQAYVALSRVRSLEDLSILPFDVSRIQANETCLKFYENLKKNK